MSVGEFNSHYGKTSRLTYFVMDATHVHAQCLILGEIYFGSRISSSSDLLILCDATWSSPMQSSCFISVLLCWIGPFLFFFFFYLVRPFIWVIKTFQPVKSSVHPNRTKFPLPLPSPKETSTCTQIFCRSLSPNIKMAALTCTQILLALGMLISGSVNTLSKKAQNDCS